MIKENLKLKTLNSTELKSVYGGNHNVSIKNISSAFQSQGRLRGDDFISASPTDND